MPVAELAERAMPFLKKAGIGEGVDKERLIKIVGIEHEKYKLLTDIPPLIDFFFMDKVNFDAESVEKVFKKPGAKKVLEGMIEVYAGLPEFTEKELEAAARKYAVDNGIKAGQVFHPVRVAASGRTQGPTLFLMLEYLGRETVVRRMKEALPLCAD